MYSEIPRSLAANIHSQWSTKKRSTSCDLVVGGEGRRTAVIMRLHGFAQCVIIIEANKDHTSVDLCLLCLNARCAKWLMPDNVSQWPLSLFCMFVDVIAREPKEIPCEGKKERLFIAAA